MHVMLSLLSKMSHWNSLVKTRKRNRLRKIQNLAHKLSKKLDKSWKRQFSEDYFNLTYKNTRRYFFQRRTSLLKEIFLSRDIHCDWNFTSYDTVQRKPNLFSLRFSSGLYAGSAIMGSTSFVIHLGRASNHFDFLVMPAM